MKHIAGCYGQAHYAHPAPNPNIPPCPTLADLVLKATGSLAHTSRLSYKGVKTDLQGMDNCKFEGGR